MNDSHPHPDKQHVVLCYRKFILSCKRKFGTARSQVHYLDIMRTYLRAKRERDCEAAG
jgi:hypothetical protein